MAKIQISIDDALLERLDKVADANYQSRSGYISNAVVQVLNAQETMFMIKEMSFAMKRIADKNVLDDETMEIIKNVETLSKVLINAQ